MTQRGHFRTHFPDYTYEDDCELNAMPTDLRAIAGLQGAERSKALNELMRPSVVAVAAEERQFGVDRTHADPTAAADGCTLQSVSEEAGLDGSEIHLSCPL